MKKFSKQSFSFLLVLLMVVSSVSSSFVAFATEGDEVTETVITSDVMSVEAYEVEETSEDEIECEVEEFVESDETSVELFEDDVIESMNLTNGASDCESELIEDEVADPVNFGDETVIVNEPLEENLDQNIEVPGVSEENSETEALGIVFLASSKNLKIDQGATAKVTLTYYGYKSRVYVNGKKSNNNVSACFSEGYGNKIDLYVKGDKVGSSEIKVNLLDKSGKVLETVTIKITVQKTNYISVGSNRVDLPAGKSESVSLTFHGGYTHAFGYSGVGCEYSYKNGKLKITGTNVGTTKIAVVLLNQSGKELDKKVITVNVSKNAKITSSASKINVDIGATKEVSFSKKNAYGYTHYSVSLSNSNCVTSWSGNNLRITGKKSGTTTITVNLYDSNGYHLASTSVTVTINRNPKLTPSASTVNLIPAQTTKVNIKLTGYDGGVSAKYSKSNEDQCGIRWSGSWSNNSITMTVCGYKQGTTKITVYLYSSSGQKLTETSVTVKVTGTPSIKADSSFNVNMGAQKSFLISVSNIASNYKLSLTKSGSSFTGTFDKQGNNIYCNIKGTAEGSGSVYVTLKSEDGTVLATKTIPVKILWVENPQITVSKSALSFVEKGSSSLSISCTGTKKQFILGVSHSGKTNDPKLNYSLKSTGKASSNLTVSCNGIYNTKLTIQMTEASTGKVLASKTVSVKVFADTSERYNYAYKFINYDGFIPLSTFYAVFGENTRALRFFLKKTYQGGMCYGMATSSMILHNGNGIKPSSFGKSSIGALVKKDKSSAYNFNLQRFIEMMHISQFSTRAVSTLVYDLNDLCTKVRDGQNLRVKITGPGGGHAVVAYKLDEVNNLLYICDSNHPQKERCIELTRSNGRYVGWEYDLFDDNTVWSNKNGKIAYQTFSSVNSQWLNMGGLDISSSFMENYMPENINEGNVLMTNSDDFRICDVEGNVVATYKDGLLSTDDPDIYIYIPETYNPERDYDCEIDDTSLVYLPTQFYVIENEDDNIEQFEAEMICTDYGASVITDADEIAFGIDDSVDLCTTSVSLEKGESYDITLLSSREGEENIRVEGQATAESVDLGFALFEGQLTEINSDGAIVNLNGVADNYVEIEATATEGGSITPEGTSNVVIGSDFNYSITPDEGYYIAEVLVNGEYVGAVEEYTFSSVDEDSTIEARFEKFDLTVTGVEVKKEGYNSISWQPAKASNGYEIYRKSADGEWEMIADVESDILDYVDEAISSNYYKYSYSVKAYSILNDEKTYGYFDEVGTKLDSSDIKITIFQMPNKTEYYENDVLDVTGLEIALTYSDGTYEIYNSGFESDIEDLNTIGEQEVNITFDGFSASFKVTVNKLYFDVKWIVDEEITTYTIKTGDEITRPDDPEKNGYKFMNWTPEVPEIMPECDLTFVAVFEKSYLCSDCDNEILGEDAINAHISMEASKKATVKIKNNTGSRIINYGETLNLTAEAIDNPTDATIVWYVDGVEKAIGETVDISFASGTKIIEVKLVDANGNVLKDVSGNEIADAETVTVKAGFFQKLISFFKNLFGISRVIVQSIDF